MILMLNRLLLRVVTTPISLLLLACSGGGGSGVEPEPDPDIQITLSDSNMQLIANGHPAELTAGVTPSSAQCSGSSTEARITVQATCSRILVAAAQSTPAGSYIVSYCANARSKSKCVAIQLQVERQKVPAVQYPSNLAVLLNKAADILPSAIQDADQCQAALLGPPNTSTYRDSLIPDIVGESLTATALGSFRYFSGNTPLQGGAVERLIEITCHSNQVGSVPAKDTVAVRRDMPAEPQVTRFEGHICDSSPTQVRFHGTGDTFVAGNGRGQYGTSIAFFRAGVYYDPPGHRPLIISPNEMVLNFDGLHRSPSGETRQWTVVVTNGTAPWKEIGTITVRGDC